jgi:hypothetical protein
MKIKKILKNSLFFFSPFLIIIFILFCINILIQDLNYRHKAHNIDVKRHNWFLYYFQLNKKKITNFFYDNSDNNVGLPKVKIFISEKSLNNLLSNVPFSTKQYVRARLNLNDIERDVQLRYFGDNPINYIFHQKSFRIKTKKTELINKRRYFEYKPSQSKILNRYIAYKLAKKLGLIVSNVRLVELRVNDENLGIYLETERLNESFLRRNKIMPVNLYKGESRFNSEHKIGLETNLDDNPGLWEKISFLNSVDNDDYNDLESFLNDIRKSESSSEDLKNLFKFGNLEQFAKLEVLEILLNHTIGDFDHDRRLIIDVWSGKKIRVPHDFIFDDNEIDIRNIKLDRCYSRLYCVINQSSEYLNFKYNLLYELLNKNIFDDIILDLNKNKKKYLESQKIDVGNIYRAYVSRETIYNSENKEGFNKLIKSLEKRKKTLKKFLEKNNKAFWFKNNRGFDIIATETLPVSDLLIEFKENNLKKITLDINNNKIIDQEDYNYYPNKDGKFDIKINLYANRILKHSNKYDNYSEIKKLNTKFSFIIEGNMTPSKIFTFNNFTREKILVENKKVFSVEKIKHNLPIVKKKNKIIRFSGDVFVNEDLIINDETVIDAGTIFHMGEDKSVIFENKVIAIGNKTKPIIFKRMVNVKKWGTIAFHGKMTNGSKLNFLIIEGGSGSKINGVNYYSSVSIHNVKNLKFENLILKNNFIYDDMMHIIYSENLEIKNSSFLNAHLDSIDVDLSKNINFINSNIINSGNDGIDFMESEAKLKNIRFDNNGDKGVSVGENSKISISESVFKNNLIGLASKDASIAIIKNSSFLDNNIQINTYKKNWRYGKSGRIEIVDSDFVANENNINTDKEGKIIITNSKITGKLKMKGNVHLN